MKLHESNWKNKTEIEKRVMILPFRSVVYALPFGNSYDLGIEDGVLGGKWQRPQTIASAAAERPPKMLIHRKLIKRIEILFLCTIM